MKRSLILDELHAMYRFTRGAYRRSVGRARLRLESRKAPVRLVLGASGHGQAGWILVEEEELDITSFSDWSWLFASGSVDAMVAEHVWEHLAPDDGVIAAANCYRFLKPGGHLRLAVPDGYHPDPEYIRYVGVGGEGLGAKDHKVLYTVHTLSEVLSGVGFRVTPVEYFDQTGTFHSSEWKVEDGDIRRSPRHGWTGGCGGCRLRYTSLIIDGMRPAEHGS